MTQIEYLQIELAKAELLRDQLEQEINNAKITITRGKYFLEIAQWHVDDLRSKLNRERRKIS